MPSTQHPVPNTIVIMGPTGAGKTALSMELAEKYRGEIINADSRQIYVGMDVGTDKIASRKGQVASSKGEPLLADGILHYLIDILTLDQRYSAAEFRDDARQIITQIHARKKLPIVVGGTGLYIRALTGEQELPNVPPDPLFRAWADGQPLEDLVEELQERAPDLAAKVDNLKNRQRVTRYLEITRGRGDRGQGTGLRRKNNLPAPFSLYPVPSKVIKLALIPPRDILRQRIEERVHDHLKRGLIDEVRRLVQQYGEQVPGLQAVGYREVMRFLRGAFPETELEARIGRAHRDYARRQLMWLKKEPHTKVVETSTQATEYLREIRYT